MPKKTADRREPETIIRELRWKVSRQAEDIDAWRARAINAERKTETVSARVAELQEMLTISQDLLKVSEEMRRGRG